MTPLDLAQISERAYHESTVVAGNIQVLIVYRDDALVIAPRGTEHDYADILTDLRAVPWYDGTLGWCHKGFLRGIQAIWPKLYPHLYGADRPVWWTGHSLGGALAILGAAYMQADHRPPMTEARTRHPPGTERGVRPLPKPAGIVTCGAPRAGFARVSRILAPVPVKICYVRGRDIVPTVPHAWPIWGPRHIDRTEIGRPGHPFHDHRIAGYIEDVPRS